MKILHILNELKPSGGETMVHSAFAVWAPLGEMHVLSTGAEVGVYSEQLATAGYRIHHIPFRKSISFFVDFHGLLRREGFDLVHIHPERASPLYAMVVRLAYGWKIPLVRTVHHLFRFDGYLRVRKIAERAVMKYLLGVNFVSNSRSGQQNELKRFFLRNPIIPNWIDDRKFLPARPEQKEQIREMLGISGSALVLVSVGGNWPYKNYDLIVEALAQIDGRLELLYLQVGPQGEGRPLEVLAEKRGVSARLRCVGVVPEVTPYLTAADIYIMPSSEEGFGVAAAEAMASGMPAILSDVPALCDFRNDVTGIEYIAPDIESIVGAIEKSYYIPRADLAKSGLQNSIDMRKCYGLEVGARMYAQLYERLLKTSRK